MSVAGKPEYKETVVGWIPTDWKLSHLRDTGEILSGSTPATTVAEYWDGGIPWCTPTDITRLSGRRVLKSTERSISAEGLKNSGAVMIKQNSVLVCTRATVGICAINAEPITTNQGFKSIIPNECFLTDYLYFSITNLQPELKKKASGSTFLEINKTEFEKIIVCQPPLHEQKKIAAILAAVDDKLDVIARQIETAQTLKQGLMQTVFSRGVGAQNAGDWPVVALHEVAEVRTGVAKGKKGLKKPVELPYLRVANVQDGHIDISEVKTIEVEGAQVERYALQSGDVLMTEGGDFDKLGRGDVWEGQISPCLHQNHVFAVRPDPGKLNSYYLAALAASDYGRQYFLSCAKRTTNLASINSSQLKAFPVLLPSLVVQNNIAEIVGASNAKVAVFEKKQVFYQSLKRGLMQKLLTGEWRVKVETIMRKAEAEVTA